MVANTNDCYILSIETSQKVCSVALFNGPNLLASNTLYSEKTASSLLTPIIEQLLKNCELKPSELHAVAVAKGPGSYTGLRIATSTSKGLCLAIDKPLISVNTLQGMAAQIVDFYPNNYLFCAMLDARRMESYCAIFDSNLYFIQKTEAKILDESSFNELLTSHKLVFFGDGALKLKPLLANQENAIFIEKNIFPNAISIGQIAYQKYLNQAFENLVTFEPYYLKEFVGNQSPNPNTA
jgi:tRNA threonylcarbamoyladenosine biosynthesis protein TsaB